ncbi:MAG: hypothetical protein MUP21_02755, partial [Dehalococcoidia bacterium]|nr:hypothetical protein [Dehalococcoidia bacterium]
MDLRTKRFDRAAEGIKTHDWAFNEALTWVKEFVTKHGGIDCLYLCSTDMGNVMIPFAFDGEEARAQVYAGIRDLNLLFGIEHYVIVAEAWVSLPVDDPKKQFKGLPEKNPDRVDAVIVVSGNRERVRHAYFAKTKKPGEEKVTLEPLTLPEGFRQEGELLSLLPDE